MKVGGLTTKQKISFSFPGFFIVCGRSDENQMVSPSFNEYDSVTLDGSKGTLYVNGSSMIWSITNDRWECVYSFDTPGTRTFKISGVSDSLYGLTDINDAVGAKSITWSKTPITITCSVSSQKITMGEFITASGSITPAHGGVTITLTYMKPDGLTLTRTVTTEADGSYSDTYKPDAYGSWSAFASWTRDHEKASSPPVSFTVEKREGGTPSFPWELTLFVVLMIGAAASIFIFRKRWITSRTL